MKIKIKTPKRKILGELNDSETSKKIFASLPIKQNVNTWGDEIYFEIPVFLDLEEKYQKQEMEVGDLAYWPPGNAFCIFFGKTPNSINEKPMAASEVTFLGKISDLKDIEMFKDVKDGENIVIEND